MLMSRDWSEKEERKKKKKGIDIFNKFI